MVISMEAFAAVIVVSDVASPVIVTLRLSVVSEAVFKAKRPVSSKLWSPTEEVYERENSGWSIPPYSGVTVIVVPASAVTPFKE